MTPGRASASSGDLRPKGIVGVGVIYGVFYVALVKFFNTHSHAHTHALRVALGSAASHRNNYVSTTRTTTTQGKHSVVLSLTQSLLTLICPFALAQFSFHFISLVFPFSAHAACLRFQFLHISISISIAISIFVFAFPFLLFPFVDFQFRLHFRFSVCKWRKQTNKPPFPWFVIYLGTHRCQCNPLDVECVASVVGYPPKASRRPADTSTTSYLPASTPVQLAASSSACSSGFSFGFRT